MSPSTKYFRQITISLNVLAIKVSMSSGDIKSDLRSRQSILFTTFLVQPVIDWSTLSSNFYSRVLLNIT